MNTKPITQHYWYRQAQTVQPAKQTDKTREERREQQSFAAVYKAQTSRRERRVHLLAAVLLLLVAAAQIGIAAEWITEPGYLSDFVR